MSGQAGKDGSVYNVLTNSIYPFSSVKLATGSAEYIANEVAVSYIVRRILGSPQSFSHMAQVHALSLPLMGGAAGFMDPPAGFDEGWGDQIGAGIKGVPAVLVAHWILQVFQHGFGLPKAGFKEYLMTAFAKIVSRPVLATINGFLPGAGQDALEVLHQLVLRQSRASNFAGK